MTGDELGSILLNWMAVAVLLSLLCLFINGLRVYVRNRWFLEKDYFGDKISVKWQEVVKEGERSLTHSIHHWRCNYCGQKKLAQIEYESGWPRAVSKTSSLNQTGNLVDVVCGACGVLYNTSLYAAEVKVLRGCTDPIPELKVPATHTEVREMYPLGIGAENLINVCKTCDGSKVVSVPSSVNTGELWGEYIEARCPDCYSTGDGAPVAKMSARRRAIEHTKNKNRGVTA